MHCLFELVVAWLEVVAGFHLVEEHGQFFTNLGALSVTLLQEPKGLLSDLANARVLAGLDPFFGERLKVVG
jgi:hypothetical protein